MPKEPMKNSPSKPSKPSKGKPKPKPAKRDKGY